MPELGIPGSPLTFVGLVAGTSNVHPDAPHELFNDKGGVLKSKDAQNVALQVVEMFVEDEILGTSDGGANQTFTAVLAPIIDGDPSNPVIVEVAGTVWNRVSTLSGELSTAEVYTLNATTGVVTFGDGIDGAIPTLGDEIKITYTPDDLFHGSELVTRAYFGVRSNGVISNTVTQTNETQTSIDADTIFVLRTNLTSVTSVVLASDPSGTNFFTGGTFNSSTGEITLGFSLPSANSEVLVTYTYAIADDAEADFTFLGKGDSHQFAAPIPSNNAKLLFFRVDLPRTASPSGGLKIQFRLRFQYDS